MGHQECASEVDVDDLSPLLAGHLLEADDREVAGAVDENVEVSGGVADQLCDTGAVVLVGDVGGRGDELRVLGPPGPPRVENVLACVDLDERLNIKK